MTIEERIKKKFEEIKRLQSEIKRLQRLGHIFYKVQDVRDKLDKAIGEMFDLKDLARNQ